MQEQQEAMGQDPPAKSSLAVDIALYTVARLGLLALVVAALMLFGVPFLVSAAVSVVVVMPLSMLVFGKLRRRVATGMALRGEQRKRRHEELQAQLRGERDSEDGL